MKKVILASASPRRRTLLGGAGIVFTVEESGFSEDLTQKMSPRRLAQTLALGKAKTVAVRHDDAIVIGADTIVALNGKVLGKPETAVRAKKMLSNLSGKTHVVITGVAILETKTQKQHVYAEMTKVTFRKLSKKEIETYVKTGEPLYVAGGYAIQSGAASFVNYLVGDYNNVVGLPLARTIETLKKLGIEAK